MRSRSLFVIIHCAFSFGEEELLLAADIKVARNMVSPRSFEDALCARVAGRLQASVVHLMIFFCHADVLSRFEALSLYRASL